MSNDMLETPRASKRRKLSQPASSPAQPAAANQQPTSGSQRSSTRSTRRTARVDPALLQKTPTRSTRSRRANARTDNFDNAPDSADAADANGTHAEDGHEPHDDGDGDSQMDSVENEPAEDESARRTPRRRRQTSRGAEMSASKKPRQTRSGKTTPTARRKKTAARESLNGDAHDDQSDHDPDIDMQPDDAPAYTLEPPTEAAITPAILPSQHAPPSPEFEALRCLALSKATGQRRIPLQNLDAERAQVRALLHATITASEGNSMLLLGPRGCGKSALVDDVLAELDADASLANSFHVIRLNGFIQTDDRLALRETWRQLGQKLDGDGDDDDDDAAADAPPSSTRSYAETLTALLGTLSHPDDLPADAATPTPAASATATAKAVVFILDEFDAFAARARQTLLYNLFDVAQSRKAPIAVLGLTTRIDVADGLEKRVRSRFSHRQLFVAPPRTPAAFAAVARAAATHTPAELPPHLAGDPRAVGDWNAAAGALLAAPATHAALQRAFHTSRCAPDALAALLVPLATLAPVAVDADADARQGHDAACARAPLAPPPHAPLHTLRSLPGLALALLVAAARTQLLHGLDDAALDTTNFALAYAEYRSLTARARVSGATAGGGGPSAGGALGGGYASRAGSSGASAVSRVWSRPVARSAWETLVRAGLIAPADGGGGGVGAGGSAAAVGETDMVRVEVALDEIAPALGEGGLDGVMAGWCREL